MTHLDLSRLPLIDHHSHAGVYERRLGRHQSLADLDAAGQAAALAWMHARVYLDFSVLPTLFALPLARWLEEWLELLPNERLLFGSDASSPEEYYTAAVNGRRQLGRALDNLIAGGVLDRHAAVGVAERVCSENARALYGLS